MNPRDFLIQQGCDPNDTDPNGWSRFESLEKLLTDYQKLTDKRFKLSMEALVTISRKGDASSSELALETINKILEIEAKEHISSNCTCKAEETTGWTTVKCCNICGKPIPDETWQ